MSTFKLITEKGSEIEIDPTKVQEAEIEIGGVVYIVSVREKKSVV